MIRIDQMNRKSIRFTTDLIFTRSRCDLGPHTVIWYTHNCCTHHVRGDFIWKFKFFCNQVDCIDRFIFSSSIASFIFFTISNNTFYPIFLFYPKRSINVTLSFWFFIVCGWKRVRDIVQIARSSNVQIL